VRRDAPRSATYHRPVADDGLEVRTEELGEVTVVRVVGELDLQSSPKLHAALEGRDPTRCTVVDLSGCTFIDSAGARSVAHGARDAGPGGFGVACPGSNRRVLMVLEIVGLIDVLDVRPDVSAFLDRD